MNMIFRLSTMLCYLKELPVHKDHVDSLTKLNLTWESLNFSTLSDEQSSDFLQNYFGFVSTLFTSLNRDAVRSTFLMYPHFNFRILSERQSG